MASIDRIRFGKAVRRFRLEKRWTQEDLAERAKLHPTYIGGIERGERNVSLDNIVRIARALGENISAFFQAGPK
jgi:transcriptional regulator with XRE-family HTH domain